MALSTSLCGRMCAESGLNASDVVKMENAFLTYPSTPPNTWTTPPSCAILMSRMLHRKSFWMRDFHFNKASHVCLVERQNPIGVGILHSHNTTRSIAHKQHSTNTHTHTDLHTCVHTRVHTHTSAKYNVAQFVQTTITITLNVCRTAATSVLTASSRSMEGISIDQLKYYQIMIICVIGFVLRHFLGWFTSLCLNLKTRVIYAHRSRCCLVCVCVCLYCAHLIIRMSVKFVMRHTHTHTYT